MTLALALSHTRDCAPPNPSFRLVLHRYDRVTADGRLEQSETWEALLALSCCRFRGHEDRIVTKEPESGYDETEVQP